MKQIPFYPNREDKPDSCMLACVRSVLEYLTGNAYSWEYMEDLLGYEPGRAAWSVGVWAKLAKQGFDVRMIEAFDYQRYAKDGIKYLESIFSTEKLKYQLEKTNLLEIQPLLPQFFATVHQERREPTLTDVDAMLADGHLVCAVLNSMALNEKPGYVGHMILVFDKDGNDYVAHDPGLPACEARRISPERLAIALGEGHEVTGIRLGNGKS